MSVVGSSVRGPGHRLDGLPCQDAWLAIVEEEACLAVVCDGLGSRKHAREGAKVATLAARGAWRAWRASPVGPPQDFLRLLEPKG